MTKMESSYSLREELFNAITHGVGTLLAIAALVIMTVKATWAGSVREVLSAIIFGVSLVVLYLNSTLYHAFAAPKLKRTFKVLDHISIYVLIAGTYTPFTLISLQGRWGWSLFGVVWGLTVFGIIFKLFFTGRLKYLSTSIYLVMGWLAVIAIKPLMNALPSGGLWLLFAGGLFYTVGVIFYVWKKLPFGHGIWHLFVLGGSVCHFLAVVLYVL